MGYSRADIEAVRGLILTTIEEPKCQGVLADKFRDLNLECRANLVAGEKINTYPGIRPALDNTTLRRFRQALARLATKEEVWISNLDYWVWHRTKQRSSEPLQQFRAASKSLLVEVISDTCTLLSDPDPELVLNALLAINRDKVKLISEVSHRVTWMRGGERRWLDSAAWEKDHKLIMQRAAQIRQLLRQLNIKGFSVTTPRSLWELEDVRICFAGRIGPSSQLQDQMAKRLAEILARAFPAIYGQDNIHRWFSRNRIWSA